MELDRPAPGPNVRDAGAGPPVLARDEPAADEEPPLKGLSERPANEAEPLTTTRKPRQRKPSNKSVEAAAAKSKARKAKPPARKKTVAKLSSKAKATSTERKQSGYEFFRKKNREVAKAAVAADPKTANLAGKDKDNVRDAALTRGAFDSHELCLSRVASGSAHVDRADGVVGGSRSFRRPRRPS
jgi:hypothetical protein